MWRLCARTTAPYLHFFAKYSATSKLWYTGDRGGASEVWERAV